MVQTGQLLQALDLLLLLLELPLLSRILLALLLDLFLLLGDLRLLLLEGVDEDRAQVVVLHAFDPLARIMRH